MRAFKSESLGLVISGLGVAGFFVGMPGLSGLLNGTWGYILFGMAGIGALLFLLLTLRSGKNLLLGLVTLVFVGAFAFGSTFGIMWYFMSYMPANGGLGLEQMFETPTNARNEFVSHLKAGNFERAYQNLSSDAKNQIPDADTFERIVTENNWRPTKWKWVKEQADSQHAEYTGEATFTGDKTGTLEVWLDKIDKHWKVSGMNFVLK